MMPQDLNYLALKVNVYITELFNYIYIKIQKYATDSTVTNKILFCPNKQMSTSTRHHADITPGVPQFSSAYNKTLPHESSFLRP